MKKLKTQRGITLIALIITIIVMLILVAVTVTVALNGGLFKTAKQATSETEIEKEKELLLEEVMGAIAKNGKVDFEKLATSDMLEGIPESDGNGNFIVTVAESGRKYTVTARGSITLQGNAGGGEEPEKPSNPGSGDEPDVSEPLEAGLYNGDTFTSWADLLNSGIVTVTDGVIQKFNGFDENTWTSTVTGKLVISDNITSIGNDAFYMCEGLTSVTIPSSVTSIGNGVFFQCSGLTEITIPSSVTSIGDLAFQWCWNLNQINVEESNPNYCSDNGVLYNKDKTTLIKYPEAKSDSSSFTIPDSVTIIDDGAFNGCYSLTEVNIPNGVVSIGSSAFSMSGLTSVTIPDSVISIGGGAFDACYLTSVTIGTGIKSIGNNAFYQNNDLATVTILGTDVEMGEVVFISYPTVYYAGYEEGADYSSWRAQVLPLPSGT